MIKRRRSLALDFHQRNSGHLIPYIHRQPCCGDGCRAQCAVNPDRDDAVRPQPFVVVGKTPALNVTVAKQIFTLLQGPLGGANTARAQQQPGQGSYTGQALASCMQARPARSESSRLCIGRNVRHARALQSPDLFGRDSYPVCRRKVALESRD